VIADCRTADSRVSSDRHRETPNIRSRDTDSYSRSPQPAVTRTYKHRLLGDKTPSPTKSHQHVQKTARFGRETRRKLFVNSCALVLLVLDPAVVVESCSSQPLHTHTRPQRAVARGQHRQTAKPATFRNQSQLFLAEFSGSVGILA
jgi:hypothetical protein